MRLKGKAWFFGGAAVGLALPFGMRVYERVLMLGPVRPIVRWLFWPTSLFLSFSRSSTRTSAVILILTALGNAVLYGCLASLLRRRSLGFALLMLIVVWLFLPPSDTSLRKHFTEHRHDLERLVQMANTDVELSRIAPTVVGTIDGRKFDASGPQNPLSGARWAMYRQLFKAAGLNDGLYKSATGRDIFLSKRELRRLDPVGSSLGYLYCPVVNEQNGFLPCMEDQESGERGGYRWRRLDSEWYICEVFQRGTE